MVKDIKLTICAHYLENERFIFGIWIKQFISVQTVNNPIQLLQ